jgi:hypothetical protein
VSGSDQQNVNVTGSEQREEDTSLNKSDTQHKMAQDVLDSISQKEYIKQQVDSIVQEKLKD